MLAACGSTSEPAAQRDGGTHDGGSRDAGTAVADQRMFVTSSTHAATLATLPMGVDQPCIEAAAAAGLGGTWVAWLSFGGVAAPDRIDGAGPFVDLEGNVVFEGRAFDDPVVDPDLTELGIRLPQARVWTGTTFGPMGNGIIEADENCEDWTTDSDTVRGVSGLAGESDPNWTNRFTATCDAFHHVFCFEQPRD